MRVKKKQKQGKPSAGLVTCRYLNLEKIMSTNDRKLKFSHPMNLTIMLSRRGDVVTSKRYPYFGLQTKISGKEISIGSLERLAARVVDSIFNSIEVHQGGKV